MVIDIADLVIALGGVLVGVLAFWVGRRTLRPPKRTLFYTNEGPHPLLPKNLDPNQSRIEIRHGGSEIINPHITTMVIFLAGTHDVPSSHFDNGGPLEFPLGAEGVILSQEPFGLPASYADGSLRIGPTLLRVGDKHSITLLTANEPSIRPPKSPLPDVPVVKSEEWIQEVTKAQTKAIKITVAVSGALFVGTWIAAYFLPGGWAHNEELPADSPYVLSILGSLFLMLLSVTAVPWAVKRHHQ